MIEQILTAGRRLWAGGRGRAGDGGVTAGGRLVGEQGDAVAEGHGHGRVEGDGPRRMSRAAAVRAAVTVIRPPWTATSRPPRTVATTASTSSARLELEPDRRDGRAVDHHLDVRAVGRGDAVGGQLDDLGGRRVGPGGRGRLDAGPDGGATRPTSVSPRSRSSRPASADAELASRRRRDRPARPRRQRRPEAARRRARQPGVPATASAGAASPKSTARTVTWLIAGLLDSTVAGPGWPTSVRTELGAGLGQRRARSISPRVGPAPRRARRAGRAHPRRRRSERRSARPPSTSSSTAARPEPAEHHQFHRGHRRGGWGSGGSVGPAVGVGAPAPSGRRRPPTGTADELHDGAGRRRLDPTIQSGPAPAGRGEQAQRQAVQRSSRAASR